TDALTGDVERGGLDAREKDPMTPGAAVKASKPEPSAWLASVALVCLTVQNSSAVLVMRYTRATETENEFMPQTAVIMQELLKAFASMLLVLREHGTLSSTFQQKGELAKSCVPAFLYVVQNNLQYLGLSYLPAAIYQLALVLEQGFFHGYTAVTLGSIALQGLRGLLIAIAIRYTDNIMKNIATSLSIVLSAVVSAFVFGTQLTAMFLAGASLVNAAAY
ncbi:unnamed protein product, partial [Prorocentrum cordatum]